MVIIKSTCKAVSRQIAVFIASLIFSALLAIDNLGCLAAKEVATNTFYVKIKPGADGSQDPNALAHQIARRNGFHNLGPVRLFKIDYIKAFNLKIKAILVKICTLL